VGSKTDGLSDLIGQGIGAFNGQQRLCWLLVSAAHQGVDLVGQRGHVGDGDCPLVDVVVDGLALETQLQGSVGQRLQMQRLLWIPLHAGRAALQVPRPGRPIGMLISIEVSQSGMGQSPFEAVAGDFDGEYSFLVGFFAPTTAVHHPAEGRLDPGHPAPLERRNEAPGGYCRFGYLGRIGLVHRDGVARVQGAHLAQGDVHGPDAVRICVCWPLNFYPRCYPHRGRRSSRY
jgi:hypothetical protein